MTRNRMLANEIRQWLLDHEMWIDVSIYFDGVCYSTMKKKGKNEYGGWIYEFSYNDPNNLFEYPDDPRTYFEYVANPHILSMSFEGPLYDILNGYYGEFGYDLEEEFSNIFHKYGVYYELGNAWNLTVTEM